MPNPETFIIWYKGIRQAVFQSRNAPHKPLTILFALAKVLRDERFIEYESERLELEDYIWQFTNRPSSPNCLQPLLRLRNDSKKLKYWDVFPSTLSLNKAGDVQPGAAMKAGFKAGFSSEVYSWLRSNPVLVYEFISGIVRDNFPETLWPEVLDGLNLDVSRLSLGGVKNDWFPVTSRDPMFPKQVLSAYDYRCCVCGLKMYLNEKPFPMEAAHIRWKARGGECRVTNGLALCPTHHYAFDKGLWTLSDRYRVVLSEGLRVDTKRDQFFRPFLGQDIREFLLDHELCPADRNLDWHRKNVFVLKT